jgi:hypothetical protein
LRAEVSRDWPTCNCDVDAERAPLLLDVFVLPIGTAFAVGEREHGAIARVVDAAVISEPDGAALVDGERCALSPGK